MSRVHSFLFVLAVLFPSFAASAADTQINQSSAVKIVAAIPEVKAWAKHIEKQTSGKSRVVLRPSETVSLKGNEEYWSVTFFEDNGSYYHLWQSFLVSVDGSTVLVESSTDPSENPLTLGVEKNQEAPQRHHGMKMHSNPLLLPTPGSARQVSVVSVAGAAEQNVGAQKHEAFCFQLPSRRNLRVLCGAALCLLSSPIIESRCKNCHGGNRTEEGLVLLTYADIMKGWDNGPVVAPGAANDSLLAELLINQKMPKRGPKLTPAQTQLFIDWINQGALDN